MGAPDRGPIPLLRSLYPEPPLLRQISFLLRRSFCGLPGTVRHGGNVPPRGRPVLRDGDQLRRVRGVLPGGDGGGVGGAVAILTAGICMSPEQLRVMYAKEKRDMCELLLPQKADDLRALVSRCSSIIHQTNKLYDTQDSVTVVGYPLGGDTIYVTKGVVSRIEYAHGSSDLLGIQIDAAINPGNSGGPAFNDRGLEPPRNSLEVPPMNTYHNFQLVHEDIQVVSLVATQFRSNLSKCLVLTNRTNREYFEYITDAKLGDPSTNDGGLLATIMAAGFKGKLNRFQPGVRMEIFWLDAWYFMEDLLINPTNYIVSVSLAKTGNLKDHRDALVELVASSEYGILHLFSHHQL
ncbi:hypothetical protein ZIOFF_018438 [Zingiber officinale]|uniref:Uncharacterized protein n=1 Tax=Zingiber officinale TaxID=94328 RepID=A0A8J5LLS7_ZINOF|nr:hypothetical protein ZIOFF_018438 [Zingiber officinale]